MAVLAVVAVVAAAAKAAQTIQQGEASARAANSAADTAKTASEAAASAGFSREEVARRGNAGALARQSATFAEGGIDGSTGSTAAVEEAGEVNAEMQALSVRYGGLTQAASYKQEEYNKRAQASASRKSAYSGAIIGFASSMASAYAGGAFSGGAPAPGSGGPTTLGGS